jgi:MFS family permease
MLKIKNKSALIRVNLRFKKTITMAKDKLITPSYCFILLANFLLFFAFYLILPVLPFYLTEVFHTGHAAVGVILSSYTVAALCIRPFSGFLLDTFARKPLYLLAYFLFTSIFVGYMLAGLLSLFIMFRVAHGLAFGMVTVAGNTIVIDITPSSRRGEAIGYYGLMNNTAMSFGPMVGLFMHDYYPFETIFLCSLLSGITGFAMACLIRTPRKEPTPREPVSLDRFILLKGIPAGASLLLLSIPYGMVTTYVAVYAKAIGIGLSSGLFFTFMAIGMAVSRMFSGKQVDKGRITEVIKPGMYLVCLCFFLLAACGTLMGHHPSFTTVLFFMIALSLGVGFGTMFPAFNSLFVNLAPHNKRGTATSTYLTSWDIGIGIGLTAGGYLAQYISLDATYLTGALLTVAATVLFSIKVTPHFHKYRLR